MGMAIWMDMLVTMGATEALLKQNLRYRRIRSWEVCYKKQDLRNFWTILSAMVGYNFVLLCLCWQWIVLVAGISKTYSQITDEDHELMTPEEYTIYFEIFQARSES